MELTEEQQEQLASYTADFLDSGSDESLRSIISLFDNDADGKLTTDELKQLMASELGSEMDEAALEEIISKTNTNGDGFHPIDDVLTTFKTKFED